MDLQLTGRNCLVTGGASGIGLAVAQSFASEGANVALWDISQSVTEVAAELAKTYGIRVFARQIDVCNQIDIETAMADTCAAFCPDGSIEHVVHCAAKGSGKFGFPFTNLSPDDWRSTLEVNIMGMVHIAHAATPQMIDRGFGTFVFLASVAGQIGSQTDPPYSASKAANINFAQCMARDLARHGVRVNTVCPGMVRSPLNRSVWQAWYNQAPPEERRDYEAWAGDKVRAVIPLKRWQTADDIAAMIVFLSSDKAENVTGQTINVDGGFVMHW